MPRQKTTTNNNNIAPPPPPKTLEDAASVIYSCGYGQDVILLPFVSKRLYDDERLLGGMKNAVYGGKQRTRLMSLSRKLDVTRVSLLLQVGADVNAVDINRNTALHAALSGAFTFLRRNTPLSLTIIDTLVKGGADVNMINNLHQSPLVLALLNVDVQGACRLIHHGANVNRQHTFQTPILTLVFGIDNLPETLFRLVLEKDGNQIDDKDSCGRTSLMHMARRDKESVCKLLVELGADVNAQDNMQQTALTIAAESANESLCVILLENNSDFNVKTWNGNTPLMIACRKGMDIFCNRLLTRGAEVNVRNQARETPLLLASKYGFEDICLRLLEYGADPYATSTDCKSTLLHSASRGLARVCQKLLLENEDIDVNEEDLKGYTPLMLSARSGHDTVCQVLVHYGANLTARAEDGESALSVATKNEFTNVVDFLTTAITTDQSTARRGGGGGGRGGGNGNGNGGGGGVAGRARAITRSTTPMTIRTRSKRLIEP